MRITNINTLSALFDRLITERIKWYFFVKQGNMELMVHQDELISFIRQEIEKCLLEPEYEYISERRTFVNELLTDLDSLIVSDIHIGESDRKRLDETKKETPDVNVFIAQEKRLRTANEQRSKLKNQIDETWRKINET
jgi:hypothetical protein